jgi:hypothetical protein
LYRITCSQSARPLLLPVCRSYSDVSVKSTQRLLSCFLLVKYSVFYNDLTDFKYLYL